MLLDELCMLMDTMSMSKEVGAEFRCTYTCWPCHGGLLVKNKNPKILIVKSATRFGPPVNRYDRKGNLTLVQNAPKKCISKF
jgi:hypothetical protein